ncbi:glycosyltransferase [Sphingomonas sp. PB2P19]|uniref:glycosyltransferase n=1 Tax=Sphingomonas rhamnosi TaxID=3096156 RepID=UPI002FC82130
MRDLGIDATVILSTESRLFFALGDRSLLTADPEEVRSGDIVIFPETDLRPISEYPADVRKWIFAQNHFYLFNQIDETPHWAELGIERVLCSSRAIRSFLRASHPNIPLTLIPCFIEGTSPETAKLRQIAYMPRKLPRLASTVRGALPLMYPKLADVPWVAIDGMPFEQVMSVLSSSAVFLSLSHHEGLGLPPLEAMASGCLVTGTLGGGGREFASPYNGLWREIDDPERVVQGVAEAWTLLDDQPAKARDMIDQGISTARRYTRKATQARVAALFRRIGLLAGE